MKNVLYRKTIYTLESPRCPDFQRTPGQDGDCRNIMNPRCRGPLEMFQKGDCPSLCRKPAGCSATRRVQCVKSFIWTAYPRKACPALICREVCAFSVNPPIPEYPGIPGKTLRLCLKPGAREHCNMNVSQQFRSMTRRNSGIRLWTILSCLPVTTAC